MHKAIVAEIGKTEDIKGANTIQVAYVLGERVIVNKAAKVGDVGIFFMPELQLSEEFCSQNNLFRDAEKNSDKNKTGFFENNRRVRAQPFMKIKSEGFFCPFDHFDYTGYELSKLKVGDQFDELNGHEICRKYISEKTRRAMQNQSKQKKKPKVVEGFKEHVDTDQFKYNVGHIPVGALISIHHKMHGTSVRYGHHKVLQELPFWKRAINAVIPVFAKHEWEHVAGTRRVVLKSDDSGKIGFHGSEAFRFEWLEVMKAHMSKGTTVYGELVGYANGKPIMPPHSPASLRDKKVKKKYGDQMVYKYGCPEGTNRFIVYRVTMTTEGGETIDLTPTQVEHWCSVRGLEHTTQLCEPFIYNGDKEKLSELVESLAEREADLTEDYDDPSHINEGVVVRVDFAGQTPKFYKQKSYLFKCLEGICEEVDTEELEK